MDKKAHSKPMREIVSRLLGYGEFDVVFFGDEVGLYRSGTLATGEQQEGSKHPAASSLPCHAQ
jgi:hypothetical protein